MKIITVVCLAAILDLGFLIQKSIELEVTPIFTGFMGFLWLTVLATYVVALINHRKTTQNLTK